MPAINVASQEDMATEITVPTMLKAALVYQVAGLTMVTFKEDAASTFFAIAQKYLDPNATTVTE